MPVARVEPLTTARSLRGPFDYLIPDGFDPVGVGTVLEVPFGGRRITAVVTEMAETSELPLERLATPVRVLGDGTPPELIELGLWVAREYCSTPARGLGLVLPPGTGVGGRRVREKSQTEVELTGEGAGAIESGVRLGSRQRAVIELLSGGPRTTVDLSRHAGADSATVRRLVERGLVETRKVTVRRRPGEDGPIGGTGAIPELNPAQSAAVRQITSAMDRGEGGEFLLAGVTGSGKTEVYLASVEFALASNRTAIVLVPEIGLTPQAVGRFRARLGDEVAVLHSGLTEGQRHDEWQRLRSGEARVCVGPRSAVFAPLEDLGLIVIDEEHDSSYKQESDPRYDARTVASRRAGSESAVLVFGTATPRPETWLGVERIDLPERVDGLGMPPVEVVDMRSTDPRGGPLHPVTIEALEEVRNRGEKARVMINRRGFSPWLTCGTCGHHWGCPNCDVSLIVHREIGGGTLICHHCSHREPLPRSCPECSGTTLARSGAGTERVEADLRELFGPMPVFRMDADTASGPGGHGRILAEFDRADSGILVGTQMVAKGHDFAEVTLSVVLDADATLRFPDFRAEERTFALVTQLAGRSGRGRAGGRVIVQTLAPDAPSISAAARHDSPGFLEGELRRREALDYPPWSSLVRIMIAAVDEVALDRVSSEVASRLRSALPEGVSVMGPAPMFRARGRHRRRILIKTHTRRPSVDAIWAEVETMVTEGAFREMVLSVDVDPQ